MDVPEERKFIGFDAYQKAMDCLKPGDVAIFATPLAFRWVHFGYAIRKDLNVFMEKPLTADGPTSRRMLKLGEASAAKNLKVGVGLMSRHSRATPAVAPAGPGRRNRRHRRHARLPHARLGGSAFSAKWPGKPSELLWQIQRFHSFIWASGGCFNDFYIHVIDHCCWMKNAWPVKAQALGGRHYRQSPEGTPCVDQNFDSYSVEYTFPDGAKFFLDGRCMPGCTTIYNSFLHGTKGSAIASKSGDCGQPSTTYKGQNPDRTQQTWQSEIPAGESNPYRNEWNDLVDAIRNNKPYNEVEARRLGQPGQLLRPGGGPHGA